MTTAAARGVYGLILIAGFAAMLVFNWPGHMSVDSVLALHEGRFGLRETWNPAIFGWLLGVSDRVASGPSGIVVLNGLLLFGSLTLLSCLRDRVTVWAPAAALAAICLPQLILFPAIVWKDVMFAVLALTGFVALALAFRQPSGSGRILGLFAAAIGLAIAGLLRQHGLILALSAAGAIAWTSWSGGRRKALGLATMWLAGVLVLTLLLSAVARPQGAGAPDDSGARGIRLLMIYDIVGAAAVQPQRPTPDIDAVARPAGDYIRAEARRLYSPERIDVMHDTAQLKPLSSGAITPQLFAEWRRLVLADTPVYLRVRAADFWQVFATPRVDRCVPAHVGIDGPRQALRELRIAPRHTPRDQRIYNYVTWHMDTPSLSHIAYAVVALGVAVLLLVRRAPADLAIAAFMIGALGFAACFFVISLACDYRYLYVLDIACVTGVLYWALDPRLSRSLVQKGVVELG